MTAAALGTRPANYKRHAREGCLETKKSNASVERGRLRTFFIPYLQGLAADAV